MPWRENLVPSPMRRAAVVAPVDRSRRVFVEIADAGVFEPDRADDEVGRPAVPSSETSVDDDEAILEERTRAANTVHGCAVLPGWIPDARVEAVNASIGRLGGALVEIPERRGMTPPTAHVDSPVASAFRPLVSTYATVPYRDIDPTMFAAIAYMVMFGMMFGDVGHGMGIVVFGVVAARSNSDRLRPARPAAPFLIGAGLAAIGFGFLYGEAFGPTGLVPALWLRPLDEPEQLLVAGLLIGTLLLGVTFLVAIANRWRESGLSSALYDASGIAGAVLFVGVATAGIGVATSTSWALQTGAAVAVVGAVLTFVGLLVRAGPGGAGVAEALVEMFDTVLRLGSNIVSFTRLAAFGLTHAVITAVVWDGTVSLSSSGTVPGWIAAVLLFVVGNVAAFGLGALVAAIQALRLEYYEMFSRLFASQGRPFDPLHIPADRLETS